MMAHYTVAMTLLRSKKAADEADFVTCRLCGRDFRAARNR